MSSVPDDQLQAIVREAAHALRCPSSAASLVLERIQLFRAHHGFEGDVATALATDRDVSYCQFVVRDAAPFEVTDATLDPRVPSETYESFGVRAYLGMPVRVRQQIVGALCVTDSTPRAFTPDDHRALANLAERASVRLEVLAALQDPRDARSDLLAAASRPTFAELRNALSALQFAVAEARVTAVEARPLANIVLADTPPKNLSFLRQAATAIEDLDQVLAHAEAATARVTRQSLALEAASSFSKERATLAEGLASANQLAHHVLKLVGGARCELAPDVLLRTPRPLAVLALSAALSEAASRLPPETTAGVPLALEARRGGVRARRGPRPRGGRPVLRRALGAPRGRVRRPRHLGRHALHGVIDGLTAAGACARRNSACRSSIFHSRIRAAPRRGLKSCR